MCDMSISTELQVKTIIATDASEVSHRQDVCVFFAHIIQSYCASSHKLPARVCLLPIRNFGCVSVRDFTRARVCISERFCDSKQQFHRTGILSYSLIYVIVLLFLVQFVQFFVFVFSFLRLFDK